MTCLLTATVQKKSMYTAGISQCCPEWHQLLYFLIKFPPSYRPCPEVRDLLATCCGLFPNKTSLKDGPHGTFKQSSLGLEISHCWLASHFIYIYIFGSCCLSHQFVLRCHTFSPKKDFGQIGQHLTLSLLLQSVRGPFSCHFVTIFNFNAVEYENFVNLDIKHHSGRQFVIIHYVTWPKALILLWISIFGQNQCIFYLIWAWNYQISINHMTLTFCSP